MYGLLAILLLIIGAIPRASSFQPSILSSLSSSSSLSRICDPLRHRRSQHYTRSRLPVLNATNSFTSRNSPSLLSSSLWSNEYDDDDDGDLSRIDISFLPINSFILPPKTDNLLRKVTKAYIESSIKDKAVDIDILDVLQIIESEYKTNEVPFSIGKSMYGDNVGQQHETEVMAQQLFSKVISFAALYRLPKDVATMLFGRLKPSADMNVDVINEMERLIKGFDEEAWVGVRFPQGLSIRLKREYMLSNRERYSLIPRSSIFTRSYDSFEASEATRKAALTRPPSKLVQKQEIVAEIDEIARTSELSQADDSLFKELLTFFPRQNGWLKRLGRATSKQTQRLRAAGRAGLISYGFLNFMWYTFAIIWRWTHLNIEPSVVLVEGKAQALRISLRKFA